MKIAQIQKFESGLNHENEARIKMSTNFINKMKVSLLTPSKWKPTCKVL